MAFKFNELQREPEGAMYVAPERICITADGAICAEDDVRAVRLLVAKGGAIPATEAARYGLIAGQAEAVGAGPVASAVSGPPPEEVPKRKK